MSTVSPTRPTVGDVARLLRARTKTSSGDELGTFTSETRPTDIEVADIVQMVEAYVTARLGVPVPEQFVDAVRFMVTLKSAMDVELSYWPEQVRSDRSAYEQYAAQFTDGMTSLMTSIEEATGGTKGRSQWEFGSMPVVSWTMQPAYDPAEPVP
jgi:hypothetical protein